MRFEQVCIRFLVREQWKELWEAAFKHLQRRNSSKYRALFYRGVANYKQNDFESARNDFQSALSIMSDQEEGGISYSHEKIDPQLFYNLGLAFFKLEDYSRAAE